MMTQVKVLTNVKQDTLQLILQAHYIEGWRIESLTPHFTYAMYVIVLARDTATREEFEAHLHQLNSDQVNDAYRRERGLPNGDGFTPTLAETAEAIAPLAPLLNEMADRLLTPDWSQTDG